MSKEFTIPEHWLRHIRDDANEKSLSEQDALQLILSVRNFGWCKECFREIFEKEKQTR